MEQFLDAHQNSNIRCVLSGHAHRFSAYRRNGVMFIISPGSGGMLVQQTWPKQELHGPLHFGMHGDEYHLDSYAMFYGVVEIELGEEVQYTVFDSETGRVKWQYS